MDREYAIVILDDIIDTLEALVEEVENLYGRETELTKRAREMILEEIK